MIEKEHTMRTAEVVGPDGVRLHVRESGPPDAPAILFIHGWSQSWLSWRRQLDSSLRDEFRLVAYDLRGHGMSDAPPHDAAYNDARRWADDLAAVIEQRELARPLLVGWSYGGYVTCDYLRAHGQANVGGIDFVGWAVTIGDSPKERELAGPGFEDWFDHAVSEDLPTSIAAMRGFVRACSKSELSREDFETVLAFNVLVPPRVRRAMATRGALDNSELLSTLRVPVLVSQGVEDQVTRRAAADHIVASCPTARASFYDGVGHMPFLERTERFNAELGDFARQVHAPRHREKA